MRKLSLLLFLGFTYKSSVAQTWSPSGNNLTTTANVGIGTSSPQANLDVVGSIKASGTFYTNRGSDNGGVRHWELISNNKSRFTVGLHFNETGNNYGSDFSIWRYDEEGNFLGKAFAINRNNGYIGVGSGMNTARPSEQLEVGGSVFVNSENNGFIVDANNLKRVGFMKYAGHEAGIWRVAGQDFEIGRTDVASLPGSPSVFNTDFYVGADGNIGIGTTSPQAPLHVSGDSRFNGQGWFSRNNNGNSAVALSLGQNKNYDFPVVQIFTSDDGGSSTASWYSSRWAHKLSFQRQSSAGLKNILQLGGADGDHWLSLFSRDGTAENIKFVADGASYIQGNVGIGTTNPTSKLTVAGDIHSRKVKVTINAGADFVFADDYDLKKLDDLQKFIQQHKHLPDIPSAKEMETKGIELGEMNIKLLQKIEELTLYIIEMKKEDEKTKLEMEERFKKMELENEKLKIKIK